MELLLWNYRARLVRVVDGDTADVQLDFGMHCYRIERLRLLGVNAPELRGPEHERGLAATEYVRRWFDAAASTGMEWPLIIHTEKSDAFGRYLGQVTRLVDGDNLNAALIRDGHAVVFS